MEDRLVIVGRSEDTIADEAVEVGMGVQAGAKEVPERDGADRGTGRGAGASVAYGGLHGPQEDAQQGEGDFWAVPFQHRR